MESRGFCMMSRELSEPIRKVVESGESDVIRYRAPESREVLDVDARPSPCRRPARPSLSQRSDRRRVGAGRAADPAGQARRAQTLGQPARGPERDFLRVVDRLPVERAAQGPAAEEHGLRLSRSWDWDGTLERIHHTLYVAVREREGREASPTAAIIDSQSVKGAQKGALRSTPRATMRARKSRAASGTFLSTRLA